MRSLVLLLAVLGNLCAVSSEQAEEQLTAYLQGCKNRQICCSICTENYPCIWVCVGDPSAPKETVCRTNSVIGSALRYRHYAKDYRAPAKGAAGCAPCGSGGGGEDDGLQCLSLTRVHFQDTDLRTSLGTKTGFQWDVWLQCFPPGSVASGHPTGQPGWQIMVSQPHEQPLDFLVLTDADGDGQFRPEQSFENRGLVFTDAAGAVVADPRLATAARLDLFGGGRFEFEVYTETDANQPRGRLTRYVDRNGNAVTSTWKYAVADPALTGSLRSKLAIRDRLTDAHGRSLAFTYDEARQRSGCWVVTAVDLPDGRQITYEYAVQPNLWNGTEERLVRVNHPDGSASTFTAVNDASVPALKWTVADPVADATCRNKTVWFSQGTWVNPANPTEKRGQIFGRAVRVADGLGELSFIGWFGDFPKAGGGSESRTYTWSRGELSAFVHEDGWKPSAHYVWDGTSDAPLRNQDWTGWRLQSSKSYTGSTLPAGAADADGFTVAYERDASNRVIRATYHDGTVERWLRNALGDVTLHRDRLGRLTETVYDAAGNRLSVTRGWLAADPADLDARTAPDGLATESWECWGAGDAGTDGAGLPGQVKAHLDANGNRTDYLYHPTGDLRSVVQPADVAGGPRAADLRLYDGAGRLIERRDARGIATRFAYDACGRLDVTTYADGSTEDVDYATAGPAAGLEVSRKDRNGNVETTAWDAAGRRLAVERREPAATGGRLVARRAWTWVAGTQQPASETVDGERSGFAYDAEMRLIATTRHPRGDAALVETRTHAGDRHVASTDPWGRRTFLVRDADERVVRTVRERLPGAVPTGADLAILPRLTGADPAYVIEESAFDAEGQMLARIDANGVRTAYAYDTLGRLAAATEAADLMPATTAFTYDPAGNRLTVTSPRGVVTAMSYTGRNLLASTTEAAGTAEATVVRTLTYTLTGKPASEQDALGGVTTFVYGGCCDRLVAVFDPLGFETHFAYDFHGNRTAVTDANGLTTTTTYDGRHRPVRTVNAAGEATAMFYDDDLTDAVGLETDPALAALLPELGLVAGVADGAAVQVVDALGARRLEVHDGLGRTVATIDALGQTAHLAYDLAQPDGTVAVRRADALGHPTLLCVDGLGRTVRTVDARGQEHRAGFDGNGNQVAQTTLVGSEPVGWTAAYDGRNRLLLRADMRVPAGETRWGYDLDGNRLSETDALGKTETSTYDLRNRRTRLTDRLGGITSFGYDAIGNLIAISDADNAARTGTAQANGRTQYAYDARHLLVAEVFPSGQRGRTLRTYAYDAGRRLATRSVGTLSGAFGPTPAFSAAPEVTTYAYDSANRLVERGYADGLDDGFSYDAAGRLTSATSGRYGNAVARSYDASGRLTGETLTVADGLGLLGRVVLPAQYTVSYAHDADSQVAELTHPDGRMVRRTYTSRHELAGVRLVTETGASAVAARSYDGAGRLTQTTWANGLEEARAYEAGSPLVASIAIPGVTAFGYSYDAAGRKQSETDALAVGGGQTFGYDDAGRLTSWTQGARTQNWHLSLVGDWRSTTRDGVVETRTNTAVHEVTRLVTPGTTIGLTYDVKGNLTKDELGQTLLWDAENRLREAQRLTDSDPNRASYAYDALGRRVAKTVDGMRTDYVHAGAQVVQTYGLPGLVRPQERASDGGNGNLSTAPAGGGLLPAVAGKTTVRVNFQPSFTAIPGGYLADKGRVLGVRTNGRIYGWDKDRSSDARARGMLTDAAYDTLIPLGDGCWRMALGNGSYTVALVAGDAAYTDSTNHLTVNGIALSDPDPGTVQPGYARGDFDGWAVQVTVTDGYLTIEAGNGAVDPKLVLVEIGPKNVAHDLPTVTAAVAARVQAMTDATIAPDPERVAAQVPKMYVYGSYIDEVVCYVVGQGAQAQRYYPHANSLYSVAALTDSSGAVVERFTYDAYGRMTITGPGGVIRNKSAVGWDRGITGFAQDMETGNYYARWRMYSPTIGRFISRDPMMYIDGLSLYRAYMIPNMVDPTGLAEADCKACDSCKGKKDIAPEIDARIKADLAAGGGADGVYQAEGRNAPRIGVIPMAAIEQWADRHNEATRPDPAKSKYRGTMLMNFLNNCVLVCGECIGSDKLGHMFQQGYEYRQIAKRWNEDVARRYGEWTEGVGSPADYPPPGSHAPRFGGYGRNASGVISFGDLAANDAGMQMYKDIEAGKFKTICDYVNGKMDEEKNPNQYDPTHPALGGINPGLPRP